MELDRILDAFGPRFVETKTGMRERLDRVAHDLRRLVGCWDDPVIHEERAAQLLELDL